MEMKKWKTMRNQVKTSHNDVGFVSLEIDLSAWTIAKYCNDNRMMELVKLSE